MERAELDTLGTDCIVKVYGHDDTKWAEYWDDPARELGFFTLVWERVIALSNEDVAHFVDGLEWDEKRGFVATSTAIAAELLKMSWCGNLRTKVDLLALSLIACAATELVEGVIDSHKDDND